MFNKFTTFVVKKDSVEIIDNELVKTAAFKLPDGIEYDPDFFYMKVRAVSAGEYWGCNKNADYFPEEELKKSYKTFLTAHAFKNHENKDIANAIGDVLDAEWDDIMKCVVLLIRIDRRIAPTIVRGFEKGFMTDVSMGCRIEYSICSYCGNKAKIKDQYCDHVKLMKHKVFPDGKKVYEINIGPKFHDISAVLNGAEKPAKVMGMLIIGSKVALEFGDELEKTASFSDELKSLLGEMEKVASNQEDTKQADELIADDIEIFPEEKISFIDKVAAIKKQIQGRIEEVANGEVLNERYVAAERIRSLLNLLYNNYWDHNKCIDIAGKIKNIAISKQIPTSVAFKQFLNVLDFAGIELSPREFRDIFMYLAGFNPKTGYLTPAPGIIEDYHEAMKDIDTRINENDISDKINFTSAFDVIKALVPNADVLASKVGADKPLAKIKAVIIKMNPNIPDNNEDIAYADMMHFVRHLMPERSNHKRFILKRIESIGEGNEKIAEYLPVLSLDDKTASENINDVLPAMLYSVYQANRVNNINGGEINYGITKFASDIEGDTIENTLNEITLEKTAFTGKGYTKRKAVLYGLPVVFGYSALQRSRIKNGENVSGVNRYIADNPGNAFLVQAIFGPMAAKSVKKTGKAVNQAGETLSSKVYPRMKNASSNNEDMFKNASIDEELAKKYTNKQIGALKEAAILRGMERQDVSDEVLCREKLSETDLSEYLHICKDCIKIEIVNNLEKSAGFKANFIKDTMINAVGDTVYNPVGTSNLATLAGNILDGAVITWAANKILSKNMPKNNAPKIDNKIKTNIPKPASMPSIKE